MGCPTGWKRGRALLWLGSHLVNSYCNQPLSAPSQLAKDSPGSPILIGSVLRGRFPPRVSYERFILSSTVYAFLRQFAAPVLAAMHFSSPSTMYSHGRARGKGRGRGSYWRGRGRHGLHVLGRGRGKGFHHHYGANHHSFTFGAASASPNPTLGTHPPPPHPAPNHAKGAPNPHHPLMKIEADHPLSV